MDDLIINADDPRERANFKRSVDDWRGIKRVKVCDYRRTRTNAQNRFMWGPLYGAFVDFRHSQGEEFDTEMAHKFFGWKFLRQPTVDAKSGETIGWTVKST